MNNAISQATESFDLVEYSAEVDKPKVRFASIDDSSVAVWLTEHHLRGKILYNSAFGWMSYSDGIWVKSDKHIVVEQVRKIFENAYREAVLEREFDEGYLKKLHGLLGQPKISKVVELLKGLLDVPSEKFDALSELICVGNGVVDLRTGVLRPHSPQDFLTLKTVVNYEPDTTHPDWDSALAAVPKDVADWLQLRLGQGLTGYPPDDDVLPLLLGSGANGKSTFLAGLRTAVGPYASSVNEKVLLSNPSDHPTELMSLRGLRLGFIEELPEDKRLPVKRLKDLLGVPKLQARYVHKDNVEWQTSHTLFVTTNYLPIVTETDHATWRRLKVVEFPYRYVDSDRSLGPTERVGDPMLRTRLLQNQNNQAVAVLSWLVRGATRYLNNSSALRSVPDSVESATEAWRMKVDLIRRFHNEHLEACPGTHIISTELHATFNEFLELEGFPRWSDQTFSKKFESHELNLEIGVTKRRYKTRSGLSTRKHGDFAQTQYMAWSGIKFRELGAG